MMPKKYQYSVYQVKRAMKDKVAHLGGRRYMVNDKHLVIDNQKNLRCDCKWGDDQKSHLRYCHCALSVLHTINKERFWEEIYSHGIKRESIINK